MVVVVLAVAVVAAVVGVSLYRDRQHERAVDRWEDCAEDVPRPPVDFRALGRGEPEEIRRQEQYHERLDEACGERP